MTVDLFFFFSDEVSKISRIVGILGEASESGVV